MSADDDGLLAIVREAFALDEHGRLVWRERPRDHFATARGWNRFNSQYAHWVKARICWKRGAGLTGPAA
jgi:hypothetical protein